MNSVQKFAIALGVSLAVAAAVAVPVYATTPTTTPCTVKAIGSKNSVGEADSRWTLNNDGSVSAQVKVTGGAGCGRMVTIAAWEAPNPDKGRPYDQQRLVDFKTYSFGLGTHSVNIMLPDCYYQIDLLRGTSATGENGSPIYPEADMMASLHGGTQACGEGEETPEPPITPEVPTVPETPVTPEVPAELPSVGTGSAVAIVAAATAVLGTTLQYARLLRRG